MAKFNLKKILMNDYDIEIVQALNFEQWVNRNMDYQISYGKDVHEVFFKTDRTTKKDFLKDIKRKAAKLEQTKSIKTIIDILKEDDIVVAPSNTEVYDKLRKSELENTELRARIATLEKINDTLKGDLRLMELKNVELFDIADLYAKFNDECVGFLKDFDLGFNIEGYCKIASKLVEARTTILKKILIKQGLPAIVVNGLIIDWKMATVKNYNAEIIRNKDLKDYDKAREKVRANFKFIANNPDLIDIARMLQKAGCSIKIDN